MYEESLNQLSIYDFVSPFGDALRPTNRWVRLAAAINWRALEKQYAAHFASRGKRALPVRCAFGSLVIRHALGLSDRQTVLLIAESPYLQYFIGLHQFSEQLPFSARSMAAFRARIPARRVAHAARLLETLPTTP
jgi:hypothetical protein